MNAFFAKKSLGQNFLTSKEVVQDIVLAGEVRAADTVVEIGPGQGVLTEALLATGARVIAVEKDDRLIEVLRNKFKTEAEFGRFTLVHQDALEFNPELHDLLEHNYKLIANIPYYITGEVLRQFTEKMAQPSLIVFMVQKEVAARITASNEKESILSLSVKIFGSPKYVRTVPAAFFKPQPKVDSAVLLIHDLNNDFFTKNSVKKSRYFELVRAGFAHKRKILSKNLEIAASRDQITMAFDKLHISFNVRAEDLTLEQWKQLVTELK